MNNIRFGMSSRNAMFSYEAAKRYSHSKSHEAREIGNSEWRDADGSLGNQKTTLGAALLATAQLEKVIRNQTELFENQEKIMQKLDIEA